MSQEALKMALEFFETMQRYKNVRSNIFTRFEPTATGDYVDLREFDEKAKPTITALQTAIAEAKKQERNFCSRCGKRTNHIHTCTPPRDNT